MSVVKPNAITVPRERPADPEAGHAQHRTGGPVGTSCELWSFDVLEVEGPAASG